LPQGDGAAGGSSAVPEAHVHIVLIEDEDALVARMVRGLGERGHALRWTIDGTECGANGEDLLIVGRLPSGREAAPFLRDLRATGTTLPVLMLTNADRVEQRIRGLEAGADDCIVRSCVMAELVARVEALGRRQPPPADATTLRARDIEMNLLRRQVHRAGRAIDLQPREFRLLEQLLRHSNRILTRPMLLESVWQLGFDPRTSVVETQMSRLRSKLNDGFESDAIQTVRGVGYKIRVTETESGSRDARQPTRS
jgi:two-component system OmpR family response regulator